MKVVHNVPESIHKIYHSINKLNRHEKNKLHHDFSAAKRVFLVDVYTKPGVTH